jgi:hypothetical protein
MKKRVTVVSMLMAVMLLVASLPTAAFATAKSVNDSCSVCGNKNWSKAEYRDGGQHYYYCEACSDLGGNGDHFMNDCNYVEGICSECGHADPNYVEEKEVKKPTDSAPGEGGDIEQEEEKKDECDHAAEKLTYSQYNITSHRVTCSCGAYSNIEAHDGTSSCTKCGYIKKADAPECPHDALQWETGADTGDYTHAIYCKGCKKNIAYEKHTFVDGKCIYADCNRICSHSNTGREYVKYSATQHKVKCKNCGLVLETVDHTFGDEDTTTCTTCKYVKGEKIDSGSKGGSTGNHVHWYGDWTAAANGTSTAVCKRCGAEKTADCDIVDFTLNETAFTVCPICGAVSDGTVIPAVSASASGKGIPSGDLIVRKGDVGGEAVMSIGFEFGGQLTQPKGNIKISLPTSVVSGCTLSVLSADGTETPLSATADGDTTTFTVNFDGIEAAVLHLSAE